MESHHTSSEGRELVPSPSHHNTHITASHSTASAFSSLPHRQPLVTNSAGGRHHTKHLALISVDSDSEDADRERLSQRLSQAPKDIIISPHTSTKPARSSRAQPPAEGSGFGHRLTNGDYSMLGAGKDSDAHMDVDSWLPAAPDVGTEAPEPPLDDVSDVEEAADDVEFPEAVVLVGKTHWRCVTCMAHFSQTTSIDDHINAHHRQRVLLPNVLPVRKRGRGRGRGMARGKVASHSPRNPPVEIEQRPLRSSLRSTQGVERGRAGRGRWVSARGKAGSSRGRGRGVHGSKGGRGRRSRGGRGRGRVFTKPLTSDDSDTEIDAPAGGSPPPKVPSRKRRTRTSTGLNADEPSDVIAPPPIKRPKSTEEDVPPEEGTVDSQVPPPEEATVDSHILPSEEATVGSHVLSSEEATVGSHVLSSEKATVGSHILPSEEATVDSHVLPSEEATVDSPPPSPEPVSLSQDMLKDLMKEKYVVIVEKAGTSDYPSECETHMDNDPPLPIETPSLQADALLPPATPILPDIHGPPETPVLPDTLHPPETPRHADSFQPPEMPDAADSQESTHPHEFLQPETPGITLATAPETVTKVHDRVSAEGHSVAGGDFISSGGPLVDKSANRDSNLLSACRTCGAAFDSPAELRSHRAEMVKFDVVSCNDCGDKFHGLHQLNIHVFTTHEKFAKKFCFLCDADCLDGFELEEHLLEHTSNETDREDNVDDLDSVQHMCKTCGTELEGDLSDLMNHYHTTHDQYICIKCHELFTDLTEYKDHKMLHTLDVHDGDAYVVYTCPVSDCFQMCSDKEALMDHISWHEDRDLDEEQLSVLHCLHCNGQFHNKVSLQRHLVETHNEPDLKPFVCELCSEVFSHSLELHRHNSIHHAGIKRYGCAYCDQRFAFRSSHRRHVASEHDVAATVLHM